VLVSLWHRSLFISHGHVYNGLKFFNEDGVFIGQESLHLISRFHGTRCILAVVCMLTVKFYLSLDFPFPYVVSWGFILSYFALNFVNLLINLKQPSQWFFSNWNDKYFTFLQCVPEDVDESTGSLHEQTWCCYLLPSSFLFDRSCKLLNLVLNVMGSLINGNSSSLLPGYHIRYAKGNSSRINAIVSVLLWMQRDAKVQQILYSYKEEIAIFHEAYARYRYSFASHQVSYVHVSLFLYYKRSINKGRKRAHHLKGREERLKVQLAFFKSKTPYAYWSCSLQRKWTNVPIEERHIIKHAIDRLRTQTSSLRR